MPEAELQRLVTIVRKLCPPKGWTVRSAANDIIVQRDDPVGFFAHRFNPSPRDLPLPKQPPGDPQIFRLRLRFGPPVSFEDYERLANENAKTALEDRRLLRRFGLTKRYGQVYSFGAKAANSKANITAYRAEEAKLIIHHLPDLYTPSHSIKLYHSWHWTEYLNSGSDEIDQECRNVHTSLSRCFGLYKLNDYAPGRDETDDMKDN